MNLNEIPFPKKRRLTREFKHLFSQAQNMAKRTPFSLVLMANYLNRLGFIDYINEHVSWDTKQCKYSPGILAQLLVLAPFISFHKKVALCSLPTAYAKMDLEIITGYKYDPITEQKIEASELNDDQFARLLDRISNYGCDKLFHDLAIRARCTFSLPENYVLHSDTTSHVLYGRYPRSDENSSLFVTNGYSKEKRSDLKQIMTGAVTNGNGLLLLAMVLNGNTADCSFNELVISLLRTVFGPEIRKYVYIADSKLLTKPNVLALMQGESPIPFISRIPANFADKLSETMRCKAYEQNEWEDLGTCCLHPSKYSPVYYATTFPVTVFGFDMHVHVYKTTDKREKVEKKVKREKEKLTADLEKFGKKEFFCEKDAETAMHSFLSSCSDLLVEVELEVIQEVRFKKARGRPSKNPKPPEEIRRWKIVPAEILRKEGKIQNEIQNASTFCLLTNIAPSEKSSWEALLLYKGQNSVENLFSVLKQPMMAATIFLEKPERIKALMTLLYFGVLLHGILRVISHIELEKEKSPPRWGPGGRKIIRPKSETMLGILAMFTLVSIDGTMTIDANDPEMQKDFEKILRVVRFDPAYM